MSSRREFITMMGGTAAAWPLAARAQQPGNQPRIGVLVSASPPHSFAEDFRRGLRTFGYTEGKNVTIEFLYTDARADRATEFAAKFVRSGVDIIVAPSGESRNGSHANDTHCDGAGRGSLAARPYR